MSIFKSYDIRGIYGKDWDNQDAYRIGVQLPALLGADNILIGRDARESSEEIFAALSRGILEAGCDVTDIGLCDTPAVYFATARYGFGGSVMITASHNPAQYNGLKISRHQAVPVGYESGLAELEKRVNRAATPAARKDKARKGRQSSLDIRRDYLKHLRPFGAGISGIKAVIDCSDGMAAVFIHDLIRGLDARVITIYDTPDGSFPHHPPNPLEEKNLSDLKQRTLAERADIGLCFDGDGDRVMFVDEQGRFVSPDLIIALLGLYFFSSPRREQGVGSGKVSYDVRSSRSVVDFIRALREADHLQGGAFPRQEAAPGTGRNFRRRAGGTLLLPGQLFLRFRPHSRLARALHPLPGKSALLRAGQPHREVSFFRGDQFQGRGQGQNHCRRTGGVPGPARG
jgi:phosphomannomutase